jgi:HD-GYP domain-containing protein (c-di-GMP phosphodiesterase class II)
MLDPRLAVPFTAYALPWLAELDHTDPRTSMLEAEPWPPLTTSEGGQVAELFGDLADLKSPYLLGHSRGVAALARAAAQGLGMPDDDVRELELAGHLHDVGRVAITNAVWDKAGRLTTDEWEQLRLHAYYSERILAGSDELARLVPLVGRHHERLDGSGYHHGSHAADLSMSARVLAVADLYQTKSEVRPHRAALPAEQVEQLLTDQVRGGRLDSDAVAAVLAAAGHDVRVAPSLPAGLSHREAEILVLLARGLSNAQIASRLVISRRTAEHHVQHIYTKIGISSRAAAAIFALEHGLVGPDG